MSVCGHTRRSILLRLVFACAVAVAVPAWAQADVVAAPASPGRAASAAAAGPTLKAPASDGIDDAAARRRLRWRNAALIGGAALGVAAYGKSQWWTDGFTGSFRAQAEGWFGPDTKHGGADKFGHAMSTYTGVRLGTRAFEWLGNDPEAARRLGLWTALGIISAVEVVDGFSKTFPFSHEDFAMNLAGAGLAWLVETHPALDDLMDLRLHYLPSRAAGRRHKFDPLGDYDGQTYVLAFKGSGMPALRQHALGRYVEFVVGYGARGYAAENVGAADRSRHVYVGIALNLGEVLRATAFRGDATPSRTQRFAETFLEFVQVPGTAVVVDGRL
jgi:hypothetical protein